MIYVLPVSHFHNNDYQLSVTYGIYDAISPLTNTIAFLPGKLFTSNRTRIC